MKTIESILREQEAKIKELQEQLAESEKLKNMYDRTATALEMSNDALKNKLAAKEKECKDLKQAMIRGSELNNKLNFED